MTASTAPQTASLTQQMLILEHVKEYLSVLAEREEAYRVSHKEEYLAKNQSSSEEHLADMIDYFDKRAGNVFEIEVGAKYIKVISTSRSGSGRSVHSFVDKMTGEVYKAAGWKAPAKGVRFDLLDPASKAEMFERLDIFGGYLYR